MIVLFEGKPYTYGAICECNKQNTYNGTKCEDLRNRSNYRIPTMQEMGLKVENVRPSKEQLLESMQKLKNSPIIPEGIKDILRKKYANM